MEMSTGAPGTENDAILALLGACDSLTDGVELAYRALDMAVTTYHLDEAHLVLRPRSMAPQIFAHGRGPVAPELAATLVERPPGLHASPSVVPIRVQDALTGCCEMALAAHAARLAAGRVPTDLVSRQAMEEAVRRAASRGARFRWRSTLVLLGTAGPGPAASRWQALTAAVRTTNRVCDEAGVGGGGRAAAILSDAGPEDVEAYVERLRGALDREGTGDVKLVVGAASAPSDSVDPDQLWKLCEQRAAETAPAGTGAGAPADVPLAASELEMELRCLPDVVSVGVTDLGEGETSVRSITVVTRRHDEALHHEVAALTAAAGLDDVPVAVLAVGTPEPRDEPAAGLGDHALAVYGNGSPARATGRAGSGHAPPVGGNQGGPHASPERRGTLSANDLGGAPSRAVLLLSEFDRSTGTSEVSLAWKGTTAVGQAVGTPLAGAAQATLSAIEALGHTVPYYLTSVERATSDPRAPVVVVVLSARQTGTSAALHRRFGVAQGGDEATAASRATLAALNRYLAKPTTLR